jgi:RHS repeat-associated protein
VTVGLVTTDRGDVVELLDAAGNPFAAYRYDAWGNPQGVGNIATGVWAQATSLIDASLAADIASRQVLRYAGYSYDSESGLYYLSARYYDPRTGQFLTKDPARSDGEASGYQYCGGNPVGSSDPSGYRPVAGGPGLWWSSGNPQAVVDVYKSVVKIAFTILFRRVPRFWRRALSTD